MKHVFAFFPDLQNKWAIFMDGTVLVYSCDPRNIILHVSVDPMNLHIHVQHVHVHELHVHAHVYTNSITLS